MIITRLEIRNCLGIKELQFNPGQVNVISGENETGKTSVLESIEKALLNAQRRPVFVRSGAEEATLYVELSDGTTIDRKVKPDGGGKVDVTQNGVKVRKPETVLRQYVGEIGVLAADFLDKKDKEQTEILLSFIPMRVTAEDMEEWFGEKPPVNLNQHALDVLTYLAEAYFYDKRTKANSAVSDCQDEIGSLRRQLPDNYKGDDWRKVVIADLWKKVRDAQQVNTYREQAADIVTGHESAVEGVKNRFSLKVKEAEEYAQFKTGKIDEDIAKEKERIGFQIANTQAGITKDKAVIRAEIADLQEEIRQLQQRIALKEQELASVDEKAEIRIEALKKELASVDSNFAPRIDAINEEKGNKITALAEQEQAELEKLNVRLENAQKYLNKYPEVDIEPLKAAAEEAERMKGFIGLYDNMKRLQEELKAKKDAAQHLDECVKTARTKPAELLKNIKMPVKGLGINDKMQITIDDMPIKNLSTSRQIKFVADIARATAGTYKIICVDRFESLSPTRQKMFYEEIRGDGYQYFLSTVGEGELTVKEAM